MPKSERHNGALSMLHSSVLDMRQVLTTELDKTLQELKHVQELQRASDDAHRQAREETTSELAKLRKDFTQTHNRVTTIETRTRESPDDIGHLRSQVDALSSAVAGLADSLRELHADVGTSPTVPEPAPSSGSDGEPSGPGPWDTAPHAWDNAENAAEAPATETASAAHDALGATAAPLRTPSPSETHQAPVRTAFVPSPRAPEPDVAAPPRDTPSASVSGAQDTDERSDETTTPAAEDSAVHENDEPAAPAGPTAATGTPAGNHTGTCTPATEEAEHRALLLRTAGISSAAVICHRDTWDFLVARASGHDHFRPAREVADHEHGRVRAVLSGRSLIAVLSTLRDTRLAHQHGPHACEDDWAMAHTLYTRLRDGIHGARHSGTRPLTVTFDDGVTEEPGTGDEPGPED